MFSVLVLWFLHGQSWMFCFSPVVKGILLKLQLTYSGPPSHPTCTRPGTTKLAGTTATIGPHTGQNSAQINKTENDTRLDYNICAIIGDSHQEQQVTSTNAFIVSTLVCACFIKGEM